MLDIPDPHAMITAKRPKPSSHAKDIVMAKVYRKKRDGVPYGPYRGLYMNALGKRRGVTLGCKRKKAQDDLNELAANARKQKTRLADKIIDASDLLVAENANLPIGPIREAFIRKVPGSDEHRVTLGFQLKKILRESGNVKTVADFARSAGKFEAWLETLVRNGDSKGSAPRTIQHHKSLYQRFGKWLTKVSRRYIAENPARLVEIPACPREAARLPHRGSSWDELMALMASMAAERDTRGRPLSAKVIEDRRDRACNYFFRAMAGLRGEESYRLVRKEFDFKAKTLLIPLEKSKTKLFDAVLPLTAELCDKLESRYGKLEPDAVLWKRSNKRTFKRDMERAGIALFDGGDGKHVNQRSFRVAHNEFMADAGVDSECRMLLRRDVGTAADKLVNRTYRGDDSRWKAMTAGVVKLEAWLAKQATTRLQLVG